MKTYYLLLIMCCLGLFSCQNMKEEKTEVPVLSVDYDVRPDPAKVEEMQRNMQIRFVPLETTDESLFNGQGSSLVTYGNRIFVRDHDQDCIIVFDDKGNYLNRICRKGEGPEEYVAMLGVVVNNNLVYVLDMRGKVQVYDFEGNYVKGIPLKYGGRQLYVTENEEIYIGRSFEKETQWLVYDNQGNLLKELFPSNEKLRRFQVPKCSFYTIGAYDGGIYLSNYLDYNIYLLKDTVSVLATLDFGNLNIPADFFDGTTEYIEERFWDLRGSVKEGIKAVLSLECLLVTDDWLIFIPGELAVRGVYYNRKTDFYMTTKYFTEPYKTFLGGYDTPDGYNATTGEFYRLVKVDKLKEIIQKMAQDKDYLEKYPFFKGIDPEKINEEEDNDWVMYFKL